MLVGDTGLVQRFTTIVFASTKRKVVGVYEHAGTMDSGIDIPIYANAVLNLIEYFSKNYMSNSFEKT